MEWNIQSRAHACQSCKNAFADKEAFHTILFDQKTGYERFDVCEGCWRNQYSQGATDRKGFVSHWQSIYTTPPAAPPEPIQRETAESLLRKLIESNERRHVPAIYILAAMLERKRLLKVKTQIARDGQRIFVYEHARTGELVQVEDPHLQLDQLEGVQHEVLHLLQHGLEPKGAGQPQQPAPDDSVQAVETGTGAETAMPERALGIA